MKYDLVVVTAANEAQAKGYRAQLRSVSDRLVIADPGGRRVGSLGATVNLLRVLKKKRLTKGRVLVCHSGGDAKRTPAYAALGKAFVPMTDARPLLDHIIEAMEALPSNDGVTICCGDVIPRLDASLVSFAKTGVTGVAYPDGPMRARKHGVYLIGGNQFNKMIGSDVKMSKPITVTGTLQKPDVKKGTFLIDTGIMHFDWATANKMMSLPVEGDIYETFPKMLLDGFAAFNVSIVPECEFFHIGSSKELLLLLGSNRKNEKTKKTARVLVDSVAAPISKLEGDNIVTNVPVEYGPVSLAKGECLTSLPLTDGSWYHLKYNIDDNFKDDGLWEKHNLSDKMLNIDNARLIDLRMPKTVRVTAPVRIDFAGGWSDTPPICQKEGGAVLAAAVDIDGKRPIEVTVSPRKDRLIKVTSKDLRKSCIIRSAEEIADHHDPSDWCCLVKSALAVTGFKFGSRGIDITISSDLPKGSGMGTSSILGAATVAALLGELDVDKVGALTLALEQEMRTGGGWEDQFAGMTPGLKLLLSSPGEKQCVKVKSLQPSEKFIEELESRSLLYFTGQKRMARNVLRRVLKFYADNPHNFGKILIDSVKDGAKKAAKAVARGDIETFAECVNGYWRDKKLLDAGSTNEAVDDIIDAIRPYVSAVSLAGAGGGGFMYILAKSVSDAKLIREMLEKNPPNKHSKFFDFTLDNSGMSLEVGGV
jgi:galactokinase/mevalonate kinase-like predicted kinase